MRTRRIPLRKCIACQEMMPKKELIRVVRTPDEQILIDLSGKKSGRGAYLCGSAKCFQLAKKSRAFDRALKHKVSDEIYDQLAQDFNRVEPEFQKNKELIADE
jgi:predicted RNA-binding protein YlxR (DUF448 family)